MTTSTSFGKRLSALRVRTGLTQQALADRCGEHGFPTSRSNIAKIETAISEPGRALLIAIVASLATDVLGRELDPPVTIDDLLDETPEAAA